MAIKIEALSALKQRYKDREEELNEKAHIGYTSKTMTPQNYATARARANECRDIVHRLATLEYQLEKGYLPVEITVGPFTP